MAELIVTEEPENTEELADKIAEQIIEDQEDRLWTEWKAKIDKTLEDWEKTWEEQKHRQQAQKDALDALEKSQSELWTKIRELSEQLQLLGTALAAMSEVQEETEAEATEATAAAEIAEVESAPEEGQKPAESESHHRSKPKLVL